MKPRFDVAIIGASLAGSTAAFCLARRGYSVALFDRSEFPRRKPCGEGLSNSGLTVGRRVGLWGEALPVPHVRFHGYEIRARTGSAQVTPSRGGGVAVSREELDHYVLSQAAKLPTVALMLGQQVTAVRASGEIESDHLKTSARFILVADGSNSRTARAIGARCARTGTPRKGASAIFSGAFSELPQLVSIHVEPEYELYATPLPHGRLNLNVVTGMEYRGNIRELLLDPVIQNKVFEQMHFVGGLERAPEGRAPIGNIVRSSPWANTMLVGDAGEEFDPVGGMGMTHALRSAELAAETLLAVFSGRMHPLVAREYYERRRYRAARRMRGFTSFSYLTLRGSYYLPSILRLAATPLGRFMTNRFLPRE